MASAPPSGRDDFEVAIICSPSVDYNAVSLLFDEFWDYEGDKYGRASGDPNHYTTGRMGKYNVFLALLPHIGTVDADFLQQLQANAAKSKRAGKNKYQYPGVAQDQLFRADYRHKHHIAATCLCRDCLDDAHPVCDAALDSSCNDLGCDENQLVMRDRLDEKRQSEHENSTEAQAPALYVGVVASGDIVIKSAAHRDRIATKEKVIAFEMEGAGVWDEVPCIVVKGVCNYADSHTHKGWQNFAAATAASAAKAILERCVQTDKPSEAASKNLTAVMISPAQLAMTDQKQMLKDQWFHGEISRSNMITGSSKTEETVRCGLK